VVRDDLKDVIILAAPEEAGAQRLSPAQVEGAPTLLADQAPKRLVVRNIDDSKRHRPGVVDDLQRPPVLGHKPGAQRLVPADQLAQRVL
jgi:hypothetical protein